MSGEIEIDHINDKGIKLEDNHENITTFGATRKNSVVDYFKNECMKFITKKLDDKSIRAYSTFTISGKII